AATKQFVRPPAPVQEAESDVAESQTPENGSVADNRPIDRRVLFVGTNTFWFQQIERDMLCLEPTWLCKSARSGGGALEILEHTPQHAVVLDGVLPEVAELLQQIVKTFPRTMCLMRCDLSDRPTVARWNK